MSDVKYPKVELRPVYTMDRGNGPTFRVPVDGHVALVNPDTNHTYAVHSDRYHLARHEEVLEPVLEVLARENHRLQLDVKFPEDGARMWAKLIFPDISYPVTTRHNDSVHPTLEVFGSYDGAWPTKMLIGAYRLVCTNGMIVGVQFDAFYQRHWTDFDTEGVIDMVRGFDGVFCQQTEIWRNWANTPALPADYENLIDPLRLSNKDLTAIGREVEASSGLRLDDLKLRTLDRWSLFNIVTQFLSHSVRGGAGRQAELFARLRTAV